MKIEGKMEKSITSRDMMEIIKGHLEYLDRCSSEVINKLKKLQNEVSILENKLLTIHEERDELKQNLNRLEEIENS